MPLTPAATALVFMSPMAGLHAKARASNAVAIDGDASGCPWAEDLAGAVIRELVAIGRAA